MVQVSSFFSLTPSDLVLIILVYASLNGFYPIRFTIRNSHFFLNKNGRKADCRFNGKSIEGCPLTSFAEKRRGGERHLKKESKGEDGEALRLHSGAQKLARSPIHAHMYDTPGRITAQNRFGGFLLGHQHRLKLLYQMVSETLLSRVVRACEIDIHPTAALLTPFCDQCGCGRDERAQPGL